MSKQTKPASSAPKIDAATRERLKRLEAAAVGPRRPARTREQEDEHTRLLTQQLRDRLLEGGYLNHLASKGIDVPALLANQTDDEMFLAYIQCAQCGTLYLPMNLARRLMAMSRTADDWLRQISDASMKYGHRHPDGTTRFLGYRPQRSAAQGGAS